MVGTYSQHMLPTHFGLGDAAIVNSVRIQWMNGNADVYNNVAVNQYITYEEQVSCPDELSVTQNKLRYCPGDILNLDAVMSGEGNVYWSVVEGASIDPSQFSNPNSLNPTFTPSAGGYWHLQVRYVDGCPKRTMVELYDTDFNGDGLYNQADLLLMINKWPLSEGIFAYDRNGNNLVDIRDMLMLCE